MYGLQRWKEPSTAGCRLVASSTLSGMSTSCGAGVPGRNRGLWIMGRRRRVLEVVLGRDSRGEVVGEGRHGARAGERNDLVQEDVDGWVVRWLGMGNGVRSNRS